MDINEIYKVECSSMTHEGMGVCKIDGFPIFVPNMIEGEVGKIKITKLQKNYGYGVVKESIKSSPDRVLPKCPIFGECGGCDIMHLSYSKQLEFKTKMAQETFKRIGHLDNINIEKIIGMEDPYYYRNKVQIPFQFNGKKVVCGFYRKRSHEVIPLETCFIQPPMSTDIARFVKNLVNEYDISVYDERNHSGNLRHILIRNTCDGDYMVVLITRENKIDNIEEIVDKITKRYPKIKSIIQNINKKDNNVILGNKSKLLYGVETLVDTLCGLKFNLSYKSFFQVNQKQTEKLYNQVLEYANISKEDMVVDAYCGVGSISLLLAKRAKKVYGIEIVEEAIEDAKENAKLNNIKNVEFIVGKSEEEIKNLKNDLIDVIVVDPPRKGCDIELINSIKEMKIKKMVYVSCNVATLARDLEILADTYVINKITLVDMFPHSSDVETCVLLELK